MNDRRCAGSADKFRLEADRTWTSAELAAAAYGVVERVSLMHVGLDGRLKVLDFCPTSAAQLVDILEGGERADASSLFLGDAPTGRSDVLLRPRIETAFEDPFSARPALALLCSHRGADGLPFAESPDSIVRTAERKVREQLGIELWAHAEVEFFLGRPEGSPSGRAWTEPIPPGTVDDAYHATRPFVFGEAERRRAQTTLSNMGIGIKYAHAEVGHIPPSETGGIAWEQHEIELALAPLARAADAVVLTQWVLRQVADNAGLLCSFEPVVRPGHACNGLHFHFAARRDGRFLDPIGIDESLGEEASWLVAGLVQVAGALMAFGNRSPDSFIRLTQGREAPQRISWGVSDRHALIRIPLRPGTDTGRPTGAPTIEFRLPDGSAQPHLLLAAGASAFLLGKRTSNRVRLLSDTRIGTGRGFPLPQTPEAVADELERWRSLFVEDGVFPSPLLDLIITGLRRTNP
jgi:glutamine synthetase